jgi:dienelactone hydrolase
MSKLASVVFLSSALWVVSATAQVREEFSVPVDYQGRQIQLRAEFQKPATGAGPFPAVIALHACGGYHDPSSMTTWLPLLWQQGYATLRLDSFTARGVAEDTSDASIACRQIGPIKINGDIMDGERVFDERRSLVFKTLQVVRFFDRQRNVLVYVAYSNRFIEGSPKNSISSVPIMAWPAP